MKPSLDARAREVVAWLAERFAENPTWVADELIALAKPRGIIIGIWWERPELRELKIRSVTIQVTPSCPVNCWTVEPEGSDES